MATKLKKPITREVEDWCRKGLFGLGGRSDSKPLMVALEPGAIISFRLKGTRRTYDIDIESVYNLAVRRAFVREKADKRKAKRKR
jgi:hypothetical protein